jgi:hypothetical protein
MLPRKRPFLIGRRFLRHSFDTSSRQVAKSKNAHREQKQEGRAKGLLELEKALSILKAFLSVPEGKDEIYIGYCD